MTPTKLIIYIHQKYESEATKGNERKSEDTY